ncbi:MAG: hypothetical protein KDJ28_16400 [Candidatus Competibacteraceae bacterium]|nr:hypothetical protein [Candidatus Competibacteraceae bacterium]
MKWRTTWIVVFQAAKDSASEKEIIWSSAKQYALKYHAPPAQCFANEDGGGKMFTKLDGTPLKGVQGSDKLIIVAHGAVDHLTALKGFMSSTGAVRLCRALFDAGLREVGLISFKACHIGQQNFLEDLIAEFTKNGILVGWLKGYMGAAATVGSRGKPTEQITIEMHDEDGGAHDEVLHGQRRWWIINGNMPATKSVGGRYKGYFTESVGLTEVV